MKLNLLLSLCILTLVNACQGQTPPTATKASDALMGDTVRELGSSIMLVFQDKQNVYWFGSWETGLYSYDGKALINYTAKHGLPFNRIDDIQQDDDGNLYFSSFYPEPTIVKFDGHAFTTLEPIPSNEWRLQPTDLWFRHSFNFENYVYSYDGTKLHKLLFPSPPNLPNAFSVYSIYEDIKGNLWFGTNPVGVCRYDGNSFDWITEEDVTEFRNEGANGVRSITEDANGDFWFNTEYRYGVYDSATINSKAFYTRHESIGGLDGKKDSQLDEYLSTVRDNSGDLWFVTYRDGVWKYDGSEITHYAVQANAQDITLFSIYKDNKGTLWLGTHENGAYKFNGEAFEPFKP